MTTGDAGGLSDAGGLVEHRVGGPVFIKGTVEGVYIWGVQARFKNGQVERIDRQDIVADPEQKLLAIRNAVRLAKQSGDNEGAMQVVAELAGE